MIIGPRHSTNEFTYRNGKFVAEASDFTGQRVADRLYDDACDLGFVLVSEYTEKEVPFYWSHFIKDGENEIVASVFKSAGAVRGRILEVHILND